MYKENFFLSVLEIVSNMKLIEVAKENPFGSPVKAAADSQYSCEVGTGKFYALCAFGGMLSCGITHTAVVPLDLVKCRMQVDPKKYSGIRIFKKSLNLLSSVKT